MNIEKFKDPDSILRPAPFWAINDRITPEETARQMEEMIEVGLSGGFFHSRAGLVTEYLGDDWFRALDAALDVARKRDGYVWLYDEDLWPSGNAGGLVAGRAAEYRAAVLLAILVAAGEPIPPDGEDEEVRAVYAIRSRSGTNLHEAEMIPAGRADEARNVERLVLKRHYERKKGWWGGESYANLLHPEAMRKFIELTHEAYLTRVGGEFGKRIPGIFTDEPQLAHSAGGVAALPWYEGLPDIYAKWAGRDFWKDLPYMYFDGPEARKIRLLMHRTILRQFLEAYSMPIFDWCEKHGIEHTGHYNAEDSFEGQLRCHCGGIMAHYRYQHAPGIDHLCRDIDGMLLTVKQVSSAARQLGRSRVLTEIFGVSRHTNTFEDFKWLGDYDLVLGANFFCPHLTWYSARGRRKRDYPPNWNYQQTYWHELRPLNDYCTRVAYVLTRGHAGANVLLLHPIEGTTAGHRYGVALDAGASNWANRVLPKDPPVEKMDEVRSLDAVFRRMLDGILNAGYDCDLGDEGYIEDMGSVESGKFRIGQMAYDVVIVPPSTTWRPKTYALLKQFIESGGKVIFLGDLAREIDCDPAADKWADLASSPGARAIAASVHNVQQALDELAPKSFILRGPDGAPVPRTYVHHRIDGAEQILFIANSDRFKSSDYLLAIFGASGQQVHCWDAVAGTAYRIETQQVGQDIRYRFTLPPSGSILLTVGGAVEGAKPDVLRPDLSRGEVIRLPDEWRHERLDPNVLVLDRLDASVDGGSTWFGEDLEYRIRKRLAEHFGTSASLEWQPWVAVRKGVFEGKGGPIILRYRFLSDIDRPRSAYLVMEDLTKGQVRFNGSLLDLSDVGWHWDRGFGKVDVAGLIRRGENMIECSIDYDFLTEIEQAYIVGDFGVTLASPTKGKLVEEAASLRNGSWVGQTYPFYPGRMIYRSEFETSGGGHLFLRLDGPSGILFKVRLNGKHVGNMLWRPHEIELTRFVRAGRNELEIEVVSSLQNSWGPLHEKVGEDNRWGGPNAFESDSMVREGFSLFNYGLLGGAELVRRESGFSNEENSKEEKVRK